MNYVERNNERGGGQPVIIGRRLTVFNVISHAFYRENVIDYIKEFSLSIEELRDAVLYCKNRQCKVIESSLEHYCDGCILRSISEGWVSIKDEFVESEGISISKDGNTIFLGSVDELEDTEFGIMGWLQAEAVYKKWFT